MVLKILLHRRNGQVDYDMQPRTVVGSQYQDVHLATERIRRSFKPLPPFQKCEEIQARHLTLIDDSISYVIVHVCDMEASMKNTPALISR